jgi:hypothetical protein
MLEIFRRKNRRTVCPEDESSIDPLMRGSESITEEPIEY